MSEPKTTQKDNGRAFGFDAQDILDHPPIGIFTSRPREAFSRSTLAAGMDDDLAKPLRMEDLEIMLPGFIQRNERL